MPDTVENHDEGLAQHTKGLSLNGSRPASIRPNGQPIASESVGMDNRSQEHLGDNADHKMDLGSPMRGGLGGNESADSIYTREKAEVDEERQGDESAYTHEKGDGSTYTREMPDGSAYAESERPKCV